MLKELTPEQIESNFNKFRSLCENIGPRSTGVLNLVDDLGEHLALCPASTRTGHHNPFPGGLITHSFNVLYNAKILCDTFEWEEVSRESLILTALMHDIGKCGHVNPDKSLIDYYVPQNSSWHRDNLGEFYKKNPEIPYMTVAQRSLWLLSQYDVKLSYDEYVSILIHDGWLLEENRKYALSRSEPLLAFVLQTADYAAMKQEKEEWSDSK